MNGKALILEDMRKAGAPLNTGKIAELTGLDRMGFITRSRPGDSEYRLLLSSR